MQSHRSAREQHRQEVLGLLHTGAELTRGEIASRLGITRSTVSEVLAGLRDDGAIVVARQSESEGRGRPAEVLAANSGATRFISMEFAHTHVVICLANPFGDLVAQRTVQYPAVLSWEKRCQWAISLISNLERDDAPFTSLSGVAVGLPGPNSATWDSDLPGVDTAEMFKFVAAGIREIISRAFDVPVLVDHHIRFAVLAEASIGRDRPLRNTLYLRLSEGVGGAIISSGTVAKGAHHMAGEIGHVLVDRGPDARECRCGRRGCLESVASVRALREAWSRLDRGTDLADAMATGDADAEALLTETASVVGRVLGMTALVTDPAEIVLAGEVPALLPHFEDVVQGVVDREVLTPTSVRVRRAALGDEAAAMGGVVALLAQQARLNDARDTSELYITRMNLKGRTHVG